MTEELIKCLLGVALEIMLLTKYEIILSLSLGGWACLCVEFPTDCVRSFLMKGKEMWKLIKLFHLLYTEVVILCEKI